MKKHAHEDHEQIEECAFIDDKYRLTVRIAQPDEELAEEQTNTDLTGDKHKKLAMTVEQIMLDLAAEKANN
ncbi:unnamed protein product [Rotaria sordida]|uniref:Uncharacterized protein n=1 Tax=Rotaria sordida TaxID=392033 RepID=A0A819WVC1_9BILA|nr:unnamed protein product [Rotaria sordida]CAF4127167.1 unnamed protein product [Rotaria sordida]